jgi:hypothetical protein
MDEREKDKHGRAESNNEKRNKSENKVKVKLTSEYIYKWMDKLNLPFRKGCYFLKRYQHGKIEL